MHVQDEHTNQVLEQQCVCHVVLEVIAIHEQQAAYCVHHEVMYWKREQQAVTLVQ
jgi:hypothetical protein